MNVIIFPDTSGFKVTSSLAEIVPEEATLLSSTFRFHYITGHVGGHLWGIWTGSGLWFFIGQKKNLNQA